MSMVDQRVDYRLGILDVDFDQHDVACFPFYECCNLTVLAAEQQVTFPRNFRPSQFSVAAFPDR